jgi:hypothetical protein
MKQIKHPYYDDVAQIFNLRTISLAPSPVNGWYLIRFFRGDKEWPDGSLLAWFVAAFLISLDYLKI